jgi:hypothetical protein
MERRNIQFLFRLNANTTRINLILHNLILFVLRLLDYEEVMNFVKPLFNWFFMKYLK